MSDSIYFPSCANSDCTWNMGSNYKEGYDYLNNSCYHNSDTTHFKSCKDIQKDDNETTGIKRIDKC